MQSAQRTRRRRNGRRRNGRFRGLRTSHTTRVQEYTNLLSTGDWVPPTLRTQLTYSFERNQAASTSLGNIQFGGNNINDPSGTSGSSRPVGYNQLAAIYNRYRVIGSSIEVRAIMSQTALTGGDVMSGDIIVYPSNSNTNPSQIEDVVSQPYARNRQILSTTQATIRNAASTSLITGQADMRASDRLQAVVGADPSEQWYWIVAFRSDVAYTNGNFNFIAKIVYDVEFFDRAYLGLSSTVAKYLQLAADARFLELGSRREKKESKETKESKEPKPIMTTSDGRAFVRCDDPSAGVDWIEVQRTPAPIRLPQETGKR